MNEPSPDSTTQLPPSIHFGNGEVVPDSDWIEIGNEFATARCRRVMTRNGARLQIHAPKRELSVFLDATILDGLTWQTAESLSLLLETPLEPMGRRRDSGGSTDSVGP